MKTRFDYPGVWITAFGEAVPVGNMETAHLMNTVKMLIQKPQRTMQMLISDIENATFSKTVWTAHNVCDKVQSMRNVTSMSEAELIEYAINTPLYQSMIEELRSRGVNTDNIIKIYANTEV